MTQGIVSVVKDGAVRLKIITGSDGMQAPKIAKAIREMGRVPTTDEAYNMAMRLGFGHKHSLVTMNETGERFDGHGELHPLYRSSFADPRFNPRWEQGTADYIEVVEL